MAHKYNCIKKKICIWFGIDNVFLEPRVIFKATWLNCFVAMREVYPILVSPATALVGAPRTQLTLVACCTAEEGGEQILGNSIARLWQLKGSRKRLDIPHLYAGVTYIGFEHKLGSRVDRQPALLLAIIGPL